MKLDNGQVLFLEKRPHEVYEMGVETVVEEGDLTRVELAKCENWLRRSERLWREQCNYIGQVRSSSPTLTKFMDDKVEARSSRAKDGRETSKRGAQENRTVGLVVLTTVRISRAKKLRPTSGRLLVRIRRHTGSGTAPYSNKYSYKYSHLRTECCISAPNSTHGFTRTLGGSSGSLGG
jgi:hypothetical protein